MPYIPIFSFLRYGYQPLPNNCTAFWLFKQYHALLLHFDNETARDKRAQSRHHPSHPFPVLFPPPKRTFLHKGWLNGISVNASFEWIFDCIVYDWIYFLAAPCGHYFGFDYGGIFANPCYIFYTFFFLLFFILTCYYCCHAHLKSRLVGFIQITFVYSNGNAGVS